MEETDVGERVWTGNSWEDGGEGDLEEGEGVAQEMVGEGERGYSEEKTSVGDDCGLYDHGECEEEDGEKGGTMVQENGSQNGCA